MKSQSVFEPSKVTLSDDIEFAVHFERVEPDYFSNEPELPNYERLSAALLAISDAKEVSLNPTFAFYVTFRVDVDASTHLWLLRRSKRFAVINLLRDWKPIKETPWYELEE